MKKIIILLMLIFTTITTAKRPAILVAFIGVRDVHSGCQHEPSCECIMFSVPFKVCTCCFMLHAPVRFYYLPLYYYNEQYDYEVYKQEISHPSSSICIEGLGIQKDIAGATIWVVFSKEQKIVDVVVCSDVTLDAFAAIYFQAWSVDYETESRPTTVYNDNTSCTFIYGPFSPWTWTASIGGYATIFYGANIRNFHDYAEASISDLGCLFLFCQLWLEEANSFQCE